MPRLTGKREIVTGWLYDSATLGALAGTVGRGQVIPNPVDAWDAFLQPKGQAAKTFVQTNVDSGSGFLPGVKSFVIKSEVFKVEDGRFSNDVALIIDGGHATLKISEKAYPSPMPIWLFAGGTGIFDNVRSASPAPADIRATIGPGNIANVLKFHRALPIPINTLEPFVFEFRWQPAITLSVQPQENGIGVWVVLYGFLKRQVA
jgi:hypothetical protein